MTIFGAFPARAKSCRSSAGIDDESALILRIRYGGLFLNCADAGEARSALQQGPKFRVLLRRTHGKYFHTAITKISDKTVNAQFLRGGLGKITKAHALDHSRHKIPFGYFSVAHESSEL